MKKTSNLTLNALIAAFYVTLTIIPCMIPTLGVYLYGAIQFRISEALCVFPYFIKNSYWGLFIGCLIANAIGVMFGFTTSIDIIVGSLTTLVAAYITSKISIKWLIPLPTVLLNPLVIGIMLTYLISGQFVLASFALFFVQVFIGQFTVCYILGLPLLYFLNKRAFGKSGFLKHYIN